MPPTEGAVSGSAFFFMLSITERTLMEMAFVPINTFYVKTNLSRFMHSSFLATFVQSWKVSVIFHGLVFSDLFFWLININILVGVGKCFFFFSLSPGVSGNFTFEPFFIKLKINFLPRELLKILGASTLSFPPMKSFKCRNAPLLPLSVLKIKI